MKHDEELRRVIRMEMDAEFSYLDRRPSLHDAIMSRIEGEKTMKRNVSMALVLAIVMLIALGSMAVAAGLGLFGQFRADRADEMSYERLGLLEEAAVSIGETRHLTVSGRQKNVKPANVREGLLEAQKGREYELTIDQVYCDGKKLYYSYTFRMKGECLALYEGEATGFDSWTDARPGKRFDEVFDTWLGEEQNRRVAQWLNSRRSGYAVKANACVGDGAELPDGTYMNPVDSDYRQVDERTVSAYYEVELPEGYEAGESIEFVLTVITSDTVYAQDETGVYMTSLFSRDARIDVPVKAQVTGRTAARSGEGTADGYAAKAVVHASDVDLSGSVRIDAPEDYEPEGYALIADGETYPNLDEWTRYDGQAHVLNLRFDLPKTMDSLVLMPLDPAYAHEAIQLN